MATDNPLIAWSGETEIIAAAWNLDQGRTVTLRLCGEAFGRNHPFKRFQQKRNGHVGSRFKASFARISTGECVGMMELMLMSWKDSSSIGQLVQFWLDNECDSHPFAGCQPRRGQIPGDQFAVVMVELQDDEQPVNQQQRDKVEVAQGVAGLGSARQGQVSSGGAGYGEARHGEPGTAPTPKAKKLSSAAHLLLTSPMFTQYLKETKPNLVKSWSPDVARRYAKGLIGVESLSDLDRDAKAVERFQTLVRRPYDRWAHQDPR